MRMNREQVRELIDRAKLYECGNDPEGYLLTVDHIMNEIFGPENPITVEQTVDEILSYIGIPEVSRDKVVGIELFVGRLAMSEFERGRASS